RAGQLATADQRQQTSITLRHKRLAATRWRPPGLSLGLRFVIVTGMHRRRFALTLAALRRSLRDRIGHAICVAPRGRAGVRRPFATTFMEPDPFAERLDIRPHPAKIVV